MTSASQTVDPTPATLCSTMITIGSSTDCTKVRLLAAVTALSLTPTGGEEGGGGGKELLSVTILPLLFVLLLEGHSARAGMEWEVSMLLRTGFTAPGAANMNSLWGKYRRCGFRLMRDSLKDTTQASSA